VYLVLGWLVFLLGPVISTHARPGLVLCCFFAAAPLLFVRVSFYLLAQNWVLVDFVANDFCWLPLRLHKL